MNLAEYSQVIAATSGAVIGVGTVLSRFIWRPMKKNLKTEILEAFDARLEPIEKAVAQLSPNGGSHLADRVIRLEERQSSIANRLDDIFDLVKELAKKE